MLHTVRNMHQEGDDLVLAVGIHYRNFVRMSALKFYSQTVVRTGIFFPDRSSKFPGKVVCRFEILIINDEMRLGRSRNNIVLITAAHIAE